MTSGLKTIFNRESVNQECRANCEENRDHIEEEGYNLHKVKLPFASIGDAATCY